MNYFKKGDSVVCIDNSYNSLTIDKLYIVLSMRVIDRVMTLWIMNDIGAKVFYNHNRFISIEQKRNDTISEIIS